MQMNELELFREFRRGIPAPSAASKDRTHDQLRQAIRREVSGPRRGLSSAGRKRALLLATVAAATVATVVALVFVVPWSSGPTAITPAQAAAVLVRTHTAVTPRPGWILHERDEARQVEPGSGLYVHTTSELWAQNASPYRFRKIIVAGGSPPLEIGGTGKPRRVLVFDPQTNTLYRADTLVRTSANGTFKDTATQLRDAIATGKAKVIARTKINGRTAYRIQLRILSGAMEMTVFVDAATYRPIRLETPGLPLRGKAGPSTSVITYSTYEYVAPTAANRRIADIQARHPTAKTAPTSAMPAPLRRRLGLR
jgi:hypothetical protein